jgi:hypothetical protein
MTRDIPVPNNRWLSTLKIDFRNLSSLRAYQIRSPNDSRLSAPKVESYMFSCPEEYTIPDWGL